MIKPYFDEFTKYAQKHTVIPVYQEILADMDTPVSALKKLNKDNKAFLLESVEGGELLARNSFLGINPFIIISGENGKVKIISDKGTEVENFDDPLVYIQGLFKKYTSPKIDDLQGFSGGAVGYMGYDCIKYFEKIDITGSDELEMPEFLFFLTDNLIVFDHLKHTMKIIKNVIVDEKSDLEQKYHDAISRIDKIIEELSLPSIVEPIVIDEGANDINIESNMNEERFHEIVDKAKDYIYEGDIFQVVLSQRFSTPLKSEPFDIYRTLRRINPSPYMYFIQYDDISVIGSSPEPLVKVDNNIAITRPIAGTRRRGMTHEEDLALEKELLSDKKELAEHIMLVDLGRNDLGRVCKPGSVYPEEMMTIERYSHVMHIVSSVVGEIENDKSPFDVLRAVFPAGTVSGAPKIRAMEIIDELEESKRGPYAGIVGYFGFTGSLDSCITIRTIITKDKIAYIQAGAGIVADSKPELEYKETKNKAMALIRSILMTKEK